MRIATVNVNGVRASVRRGFVDWLVEREPDLVALQEVRAPSELVPVEASTGYHFAYHPGNRAGRNGVALLSRTPPTAVREGFGHAGFDPEGRYLEADYDLCGWRLTVASLYLPKGGRADDTPAELARYRHKQRFMRSFRPYLTRARKAASAQGREFLVMGDFNIAHTRADLRNWRSNARSVGFLPEEREWLGSLLGPRTLVDVVRTLRPEEDGPYSWWSWLGNAFTNDTGWRIDYHFATRRSPGQRSPQAPTGRRPTRPGSATTPRLSSTTRTAPTCWGQIPVVHDTEATPEQLGSVPNHLNNWGLSPVVQRGSK